MRLGTRTSLIFVVAVAVIPVLALLTYDFVRNYREETASARETLARLVNTVAVTNRSIVSGSETVLRSLLDRASITHHDNSVCSSEFAQFLAHTKGYLNAGIIERDGTLSCSGIPVTQGSINLSKRGYFQRALSSHGLALGRFQIGHATHARSINIALAGKRPDGTIAVAFLALDLDWLSKAIFHRVPGAPQTHMVLTDRTGTVLADWPDNAGMVGTSIAKTPLFSVIHQTKSNVAETRKADGDQSIVASAAIPVGSSPGLFLAASEPVTTVTAAAVSNLEFNLGIFALGAVIVLFLAWLFADRLVRRPLARIAQVAGDFAAGKTDARIGTISGTGEIRSVGAAIDRMANSLAEQNARLFETNTELRQAHDTLDAVVNASPSAIICLDTDEKVTLWNPAAERMFGWMAAEVLGQPYPAVPETQRLNFRQHFERALRGESVVDASGTRVTRDGREVHISLNSAPLYDKGGDVTRVMYVVNDITHRLQIQRELQHAQKMEAVGQLTGGMAHDFNNLLAVIIGNLDLVSETVQENSQTSEDLQAALGAALRGAELTRQLLAFSRRQPLQPKRIDVNALVSNLTSMLKRTLGEQIVIETKFVAEPWSAVVDPSQVESALMNMAVNARDAMPEGGRLIIETDNRTLDADYVTLNPEAIPGDYVMLSVSDTGAGIPSDVLQRVFEPFFTTKGEGVGTGLGLSMVYGFVKQSGGHIKIYSEPGVGTTIRLYLPKADAADDLVVEDAAPDQEFSGQGQVIMVVEDKSDVRRIVCRQLRELGYEVLEAEDTKSALDTLRSAQAVDLLFTDVVMPGGLSGPDLAREARNVRADLKVLFTSGFPEAARNGGNFAPDDMLLSKPYRRKELAMKLRQALG